MAANQGHLGPLTFEAREKFLQSVRDIQHEINCYARREKRPVISLINYHEHERILELIKAGTYPNGWDGSEMRGDEMTDKIHRDGTIQPWMFGEDYEI